MLKQNLSRIARPAAVSGLLLLGAFCVNAHAIDPTKTVGSDACVDCHSPEHDVWAETTHAKTYDELSSSDAAIEIADALGIDDIEAPDGTCVGCHYTLMGDTVEDAEPISGISCESCHGAAADWIDGHGKYVSGERETETPAEKATRIAAARAAGQIRPDAINEIAANCLGCHTVPNEKLVNVGGHPAGSKDFELVDWSQGEVRHNLFWTGGKENAKDSPERKRVLYVVGIATDLEFSLRALAKSTGPGEFRTAMTDRVKAKKAELAEINGKINSPDIGAALSAANGVNVSAPDAAQLVAAADKIKQAIASFTKANDGSALAAVDPLVPSGEGRYSDKY